MVEHVTLHFFGAYSFLNGEKSLFHSPYANDAGIYLWVIKNRQDNLNYIHYIGETSHFAKRQREHSIQILGLNYRILDSQQAINGIEKIVWNGLWRDKTREAVGKTIEQYHTIGQYVTDYISIIDIYFAPTQCSKDLRKHIEGCIGKNLRMKYSEWTRFYPDDNQVGTKSKGFGDTIRITTDEDIIGFDPEMMI